MNRLVFAALVAALFLLVACGDDDSEVGSQSAGFPLAIQQTDGELLTLEAPPKRIVSLSAHATQIICAIGAGDRLAAVERYANCPQGGGDIPALDSFKPSVEAIVGFEPDLVYVSGNIGGIVGALRRTGTPVLYLALPASLDGIAGQIELFGQVTGHEADAGKVMASMSGRIEAIERRLAAVEQGPRIFHELTDSYYTAAPRSFIGDFYRVLKARNIAEGADGDYPQLSAEVIIERDPEVIVLADEAAGVTSAAVAARPGWSRITAVRDRRICLVDPDLVSQPGPAAVDGLEALAKCLYPGLFP